jgi:hypothetical protein
VRGVAKDGDEALGGVGFFEDDPTCSLTVGHPFVVVFVGMWRITSIGVD